MHSISFYTFYISKYIRNSNANCDNKEKYKMNKINRQFEKNVNVHKKINGERIKSSGSRELKSNKGDRRKFFGCAVEVRATHR